MNYGFNSNQFHKDVDDFVSFFTGFAKSFGPSAKKVSGKEIGFFEEMHIRFRHWLVDLGISHVIRMSIMIVVGIILWITIFRHAMLDVQILTLFGFLVLWGWFMNDHLLDKGAPVGPVAQMVLGIRDFGFSLFEGIKEFFMNIFYTFFPESVEKKK